MFHRDLDFTSMPNRLFSDGFDGCGSIMLAFSLKIDGSITPSDFRRAWIHCRHEHPVIAAYCRPSSRYPNDPLELTYRVQSPSEIDEWADRTLVYYSGDSLRDDSPEKRHLFNHVYNIDSHPRPSQGIDSASKLHVYPISDGKTATLVCVF